MTYCANCDAALLERTVSGRKVLMCTQCGSIFEQTDEIHYRYAGTTHGNQQLRELLAVIDKEEQNNETLALKTDPDS